MWETRNAFRNLDAKPLLKWPLGRLMRNYSSIAVDLRELGCEDGRWMKLAQVHACPVVGLGISNVESLCYVTRVIIFHTVEMVFSQREQYNQEDSFLFHIIMMIIMICL
jgi:hypothetical protein